MATLAGLSLSELATLPGEQMYACKFSYKPILKEEQRNALVYFV
jgi:hypothetical protein